MPRLDQNQAAFSAKRLVLAEVRAADPAALRVAPVFVLKHAFDHKNFFAPVVAVRIEKRARRPAHQGGVRGPKFREW